MKNISFLLMAIFAIITITPFNSNGSNYKDTIIFNKIIKELSKDKQATTSERVVIAAKILLETPYTAGTLEQVPEKLIINLHETDCILFAETCLALAITSNSDDISFNNFTNIIKKLRYRDGVIDGYSSRLHYTSEWIIQGEKNGFIKEMSKEIANTPNNQEFFFMSSHPQSYKQLSKDSLELAKIVEIEKLLNKNKYFFIPKAKIYQYIKEIKPGDIIGFNTSTAGLDMTHIGIAYIHNGKLSFIHASMTGKKVMIEPTGLIEYINKIKYNNGIRIIRPI